MPLAAACVAAALAAPCLHITAAEAEAISAAYERLQELHASPLGEVSPLAGAVVAYRYKHRGPLAVLQQGACVSVHDAQTLMLAGSTASSGLLPSSGQPGTQVGRAVQPSVGAYPAASQHPPQLVDPLHCLLLQEQQLAQMVPAAPCSSS